MLCFLHFQRQKHATILARNTIPRIPPTRTGVEKKEELDATVAAATAPVPVFETDGSGKVIDEFRAGLAASSTVAAGNPALESSLLMLPAASLPATSSAAASPAAMMRVSTRMPSAKRCRRLLMLSILYITTASLAPVKL
jgi:hypothetical protein